MTLTSRGSKDAAIDPEALDRAAECLKSIAHPTRQQLLALLLEREHTVGELAERCGVKSHIVSEHLGLMRDRGLLTRQRRGRCIYYTVTMPAIAGIIDCVRSHFGQRVL